MPTLLKNMNIQFISLVKKGANKKTIIYKTAENPPETWTVPVKKTDEDKQMVYGIVYAPDEIDSQGDYSTADEITLASYRFMKGLNLQNIDKQHSFDAEDAFVAESWLVKEKDSVFPDEKEGAWAVGIKIEGEELWEQVKKGDIEGLSMAGTADRIIDKATSFNDEQGLKNLWDLNSSLESSIRSIMVDEDIKDKQAAINASLDEFRKTLNAQLFKKDESILNKFVNKMKQALKKEEPNMEKKEVQAIVKEMLKSVEKEDPKADDKTTAEEEATAIIKKAINEKLKPLIDRIKKIEEDSPGSKQDNEEIKKEEADGAAMLIEDAKSRTKEAN